MPTSYDEHYVLSNTIFDPIVGAIAFTKPVGDEITEQNLIDTHWIQRLKRIHQLQSAWWVFPSAEHSRFQHSLGVMHLAGIFADHLYWFLRDAAPKHEQARLPGPNKFIETARIAGLLHDIGHGPFGHFFDEVYLSRWSLNHETLGRNIIESRLKHLIEGIRRSPFGPFLPDERLEAADIGSLICKNLKSEEDAGLPPWLRILRTLFVGPVTVDSLDFIQRDGYMTGIAPQVVDCQRLLHYSHVVWPPDCARPSVVVQDRAVNALARFLETRLAMFHTVYHHRVAQAIEFEMKSVFDETMSHFLDVSRSPLEQLEAYLHLDDWSFVTKGYELADKGDGDLKLRWESIITRNPRWRLACERTEYLGDVHPMLTTYTASDIVDMIVTDSAAPGAASIAPEAIRVSIQNNIAIPQGDLFIYHPDYSSDDQLEELSEVLHGLLPEMTVTIRVFAVASDMERVRGKARPVLASLGKNRGYSTNL